MRPNISRVAFLCLLIISFGITFFLFPQSQTQVGYMLLTADAGTRIPVATALFTFTNDAGILVSQAGVGAVDPIPSGRIFVDQNEAETGFALVNPTSQLANVTLVLRSSSGTEVGRKPLTLDARKHTARFVSEFFDNMPSGFSGSMTFESTQQLTAITLRQSINARGEPLYTTLPVLDLSRQSTTAPIIFPQIAAGEGYSTQVILINPTQQIQKGTLSVYGNDGNTLPLKVGSTQSSSFGYQIEGQGTYRIELEKDGGVQAGYMVVTPEAGSFTPSGSAVFRYRANGKVVTEAGVGGARPTTALRIFVDNAKTLTGVAIANTENQQAAVSMTLFDRNGVKQDTVIRNLPARGHLALFVNELFPGLSGTYNGLLEITSTTPISAITLKLTINERNDLVYTTLPVADLNSVSTSTQMVFPHIAFGGGFSTRLIFINTDMTKSTTGKLSFYKSDSTAMTVLFGSLSASQIPFHLLSGGGSQYYPNYSAKVASIAILDPETNQPMSEIAVSEGSTLKASLLVLDESGLPRDDFSLNYVSLDQDVATIDGGGFVTGKKSGFSTLTISSGGTIATGTINVVGVKAGAGGYKITGIAQDLAKRLYLAATDDNAILLAQDLGAKADVYAGIRGQAGLRNDTRLNALFRKPAFLALDQAKGTMYVSDGENNAIRKVEPGLTGKVEIYAGTGERGYADGPAGTAKFSNPQGVTFDNRGYLWVVDSGNSVIRRISLSSGTVTTVAGKSGQTGWVDGKGDQARFSNPVGIALEPEPLARQLEREAKGEPPPPVSVIITDTGNSVLRRVKETGEVETIRLGAGSGIQAPGLRFEASGTPLILNSPTGIAVDSIGNIYASERQKARVRAVLTTGNMVSAVQSGTLVSPAGIVFSRGSLLVADGSTAGRELIYGQPFITSISPARVGIRGGEKVTIIGGNFPPESIVFIAGFPVAQVAVKDTKTIEFTVPSRLLSGRTTLSVHCRTGVAQAEFQITPIPLSELQPMQITTYAGGTTFVGDGSLATAAYLDIKDRFPQEWGSQGSAIDSRGNIYTADTYNHRVRRIDVQSGIITTVAGTGEQGLDGDGGPAVSSVLNEPRGVALDLAGNLYIADTFNYRVRKVDARTGIISTIAGSGPSGYVEDGKPATSSALNIPMGLAFDTEGNLYVADTQNHLVRRIDASTSIITTFAGRWSYMTPVPGYSGDGGPATAADLSFPTSLVFDRDGNLLIADNWNGRIRKVEKSTGKISTIAGGGSSSADGINATSATLGNVYAVAVSASGDILLTATNYNCVRKINRATGVLTTVAGTCSTSSGGFSGDGGPALGCKMNYPKGISLDSADNIYIADGNNNRLRRVEGKTGNISTAAGGSIPPVGDGYLATMAKLTMPHAVAVDGARNLFIADTDAHRIRKVDAATLNITTVAGTGEQGHAGDGALAVNAKIATPIGIVTDKAGNVLFVEHSGHSVRKIDASTGIITTVAGTGVAGFSGDNGPATSARISWAWDIYLDADENLFIADYGNFRIRRVDAKSGVITTIAGTGTQKDSGDGGPATAASLQGPHAVAVDLAGNVHISESYEYRLRTIAVDTGIITSRLMNFFISRMKIDSANNIYFADGSGGVLGKLESGKQTPIVVAGSWSWKPFQRSTGDGGDASSATFNRPWGLTIDSSGNMFIAETFGNRIRVIRGPLR